MLTGAASVITALRGEARPWTIAEIAQQTGLSRPTVAALLKELTDDGWVDEDDATPTGRPGPPARRYAFRGDRGLVLGVDVGLRSLRIVACDLTGALLDTHAEQLDVDLAAERRYQRVVDGVRATAARHGSPLLGVGIGVPGVVGRAGEMRLSRVIPDWTGTDLEQTFGRALGCRVVAGNDTKLAALAEARVGAGTMAETMVLVWIGHRISTAAVIGGRLHRGWNGIAGELTGSTEMSWTKQSVVGQWPWPDAGSPMATILAAAAGDDDARRERDAFVDEVAAGVSLMVAAIDPNVVVLGGALAAGGHLTDPLRAAVQRRMTLPVDVSELTSRLAGFATAMGGAVLAFETGGTELTARDGVSPARPAFPADHDFTGASGTREE